MSKLQMPILAVLLSLLFASLDQAASLSEDSVSISGDKRQSADVRMAEMMAEIALAQSGIDPHAEEGCEKVACGVVDVYASGKKKRDPNFPLMSDAAPLHRLLRAHVKRAATKNSV